MNRNVIQVFEYEKLRVGEMGFKEFHFQQLVKLNEKHGNQYFSVGNKKIYFTQYVGVIQIGNLIIEILPKADKHSINKSKWQKALMQMLKESGLLRVHSPTHANVKLRSATMMDLFIEHFISEVENIIRRGMIKKYRTNKNNSSTLKGKLLFNEQIKNNLIHKERFFNQYTVYDKNNVYNKIIAKALKTIDSMVLNDTLYSRVKNLMIDLEDVEDLIVNESIFDNLTFDRKTVGYKKAIDISKMILLNFSPDIQCGKDNLLSLLFDMNEVFERFIYHRIKKTEGLYGEMNLVVKPQQSKKFWNSKSIRPDIIIEYTDSITGLAKKIVLDTKWKIVKPKFPSDNDLKQIYTYNLHFGAQHGYLLYPKVGDVENCGFNFHNSVAVSEVFSHHTCSQMFVDMFDEYNNINLDLGKNIIKIVSM